MIPFYLITGFLGSGKTTLLLNILEQYSDDKRIAVIQNEFAPAGTDGKELKMKNKPFRLVEVNQGSVFCVCMLGTFIDSLDKLIENHNPEMIFLEASGLSDPINIIELLQDERIKNKVALSHIFSIADAPNFERGLKTLNRVRHHLMVADTVLLNKSDLYDGDTGKLEQKVMELNPFAKVVKTSFCHFDLKPFIDKQETEHKAAVTFAKKESEGRPDMKAIVLRIHEKISLDGLKLLISELREECIRIKGFVNCSDDNTYGIQTVFESFDYRMIHDYTGPSEIIAFTEKLTPRELRNKFLKHASES